jgi:hypothetical protein
MQHAVPRNDMEASIFKLNVTAIDRKMQIDPPREIAEENTYVPPF